MVEEEEDPKRAIFLFLNPLRIDLREISSREILLCFLLFVVPENEEGKSHIKKFISMH